nr:hypothetical protein [Steroidobacteraceae bacterium]
MSTNPLPQRAAGSRARTWRAPVALIVTLLSSSQALAATAADPRATALISELGLQADAVASRDLPGWEIPKRIVVVRASAARLGQLQASAPGVELLAAAEGDALVRQLAGAQAVIGLCDAATLAAAPSLRWIQALSVGVENCVAVPGLLERSIVLTNMQRTSAPPIAEHAIALTLALARGLPQYARYQQAGQWQQEQRLAMREMGGRTMLVVGLGGIGTEVARRAHGLGMRVIATRN